VRVPAEDTLIANFQSNTSYTLISTLANT